MIVLPIYIYYKVKIEVHIIDSLNAVYETEIDRVIEHIEFPTIYKPVELDTRYFDYNSIENNGKYSFTTEKNLDLFDQYKN